MWWYVLKRLLLMIPTLFVISLLVYLIIDLPPGDCVTAQIDELLSRGDPDALNRAEELRHLYGLDQSLMHRYFTWFFGIFHWDFGLSCQDTVPVKDLIGERIVLTMVMESATIAFIWIVSFVIGVYAATHQYRLGDYVASFIGFVGLGNMGGPMCRRLVEAGYSVVAFDLSATALDTAVAAGATAASSAADAAARCDIFLTSLPRPDHVEAVMRGTSVGMSTCTSMPCLRSV